MRNNSIYWCGSNSTSDSGIYRVHPDGSGFAEVVTTGIGRQGIRGIAIDWVARKYPLHILQIVACLINRNNNTSIMIICVIMFDLK